MRKGLYTLSHTHTKIIDKCIYEVSLFCYDHQLNPSIHGPIGIDQKN